MAELSGHTTIFFKKINAINFALSLPTLRFRCRDFILAEIDKVLTYEIP